jgi:hypothetical protein
MTTVPRRRVLRLLILGVGLLVPASPGLGQAPKVYVIAATGVSLSSGDVKEVYLGEKQFSGSLKLVPVDNAATRDAFLSKVLNMGIDKYQGTWTKKAFRDALNPPRVLSTDAEVVEFVKRTAGAVGYVAGAPAGVTVVHSY